jgi:hypothetical protein
VSAHDQFRVAARALLEHLGSLGLLGLGVGKGAAEGRRAGDGQARSPESGPGNHGHVEWRVAAAVVVVVVEVVV